MMTIFIGLCIGLVLGLTGAGGSLFAVPLLVLLMGYEVHMAIGLSLGIVAFNALFGLILQLRSNSIQWAPAIAFLIIGSLISPIGNYFRGYVSESVLLIGFTVLVFIVASRLWVSGTRNPSDSKAVRSSPYAGQRDQVICPVTKATFKVSLPCVLGMSGMAAITGVLSGLFGVGGGFIIVPSLMRITGIAIQQAVATSLVIISAISLSGFLGFIASTNSDDLINQYGLDFLLIIGSGFIAMLAARALSHSISGSTLQKLFAVLAVSLTLLTLIQQY